MPSTAAAEARRQQQGGGERSRTLGQSAMNAHASTSSINGDAGLYGDELQEAPAFPSLTPLSHDLALLSPTQTPNFSVDDFLLSRTKASDLNFILSDLRSYSEKLKDELYSIINEDYKDFVSLGSSLKSEAHRIARLGWNARSIDADSQEHVPSQGLMAPVRETLLASRSMLKSVQEDIEDCIRRKEDAGSHKTKLELMLQLDDSIVRLEDLLLIQDEAAKKGRRRSSHAARRPSLLSITSVGKRRDSVASAASGSDQELSDYAMSSEYEDESDSDEDLSSDEPQNSKVNGHGRQKRARRKILRRFSSGAPQSSWPTRSSDDHSPTRTRTRSDTLTSNGASASSSMLGLPQRIARTSAEYSRLRFLHRRIDEENLSHFTDALQDRIDNVRSRLRQDVRTLLAHLLSPQSLLMHGQSSAKVPSSPELRKAPRSSPIAASARRTSFLQSHPPTIHEQATNELDAWSQIAEPVEQGAESTYWEARLEEQRSWLEMALSTLNALPLVSDRQEDGDEGVGRRGNEAEEAVRDLLVLDWATKNIGVDKESLGNDVAGQGSFKDLPPAVQALFAEHRSHISSLLLSSSSSSDPLVELYNSILTFVATTAFQVCDASREISHQLRTSSSTVSHPTSGSSRNELDCDIFTNVIWSTLSSRLLDTMGNTIFFVGQTDLFYSNFTLTSKFLSRFLDLAPRPESRAAMQAHANWSTFKRRWQLPVYFQMRFREVVTEMEAKLAEGGGRRKTEVGGEECMEATRGTVEAMERVWGEGVHIHELSAREWRVTLQLLSRYKTWVEEQSPVEVNRQHELARISGGGGTDSRTSLDRSSVEISRVSTPQPAGDLSGQQQDDEQLEVGVHLVRDCLLLRRRMEEMLDEVILHKIGQGVELDEKSGLEGLRSDLWSVLDGESLSFIPGLTSSIGRLAYNLILPRVVSPLRMLRSFSTPTYRPTTSEGGPAVQVIHQMFTPLTAFLTLCSSLPISTKRHWTAKILSETFKRYTSTIETVNKNQQSLIKLKKSQAPTTLLGGLWKSNSSSTGGGGGDTTDLEKSFEETNRHALATFERLLEELHLDFDLDEWDAWIALKNFLLSGFDQL
ncbi:hypothetical protein PHSY_003399 [Pseudozyma hubeiensis SY62]|uniref:Conserved oligomeric Golgi complex subunit 2 n=1 Tax=Pseudozyma hubeiensis (strain SY62) TaxID=1305764 RepID=R9P3M2_PSEHS|nr:hypothetical protein PHSY_003399 [Pseudozyma hubeiensis SY62]GAC95822.1 hypothetical protein PHSY_003399 [Pseudozyma hubeiensis SY62]